MKIKLNEEFLLPLDEVHRDWLRKPVTVIIFVFVALPAFLIVGILQGMFKGLSFAIYEFLLPCWNGKNK